MDEVIIIGTGGLAKELCGMVRNMGYYVLGFVAKTERSGNFCGSQIRGDDEWFLRQTRHKAIIANGKPVVRCMIAEMYGGSYHVFPTIIHPRAIIFGSLVVGDGTTVMPGGVIQPLVKLGNFVHVNMGCTIGHDVTIGDYCVINHNAGISGGVTIGSEVLIGAGALIREDLTIGDGATVGMGAVVTKDVPEGETWVGCPAKRLDK